MQPRIDISTETQRITPHRLQVYALFKRSFLIPQPSESLPPPGCLPHLSGAPARAELGPPRPPPARPARGRAPCPTGCARPSTRPTRRPAEGALPAAAAARAVDFQRRKQWLMKQKTRLQELLRGESESGKHAEASALPRRSPKAMAQPARGSVGDHQRLLQLHTFHSSKAGAKLVEGASGVWSASIKPVGLQPVRAGQPVGLQPGSPNCQPEPVAWADARNGQTWAEVLVTAFECADWGPPLE